MDNKKLLANICMVLIILGLTLCTSEQVLSKNIQDTDNVFDVTYFQTLIMLPREKQQEAAKLGTNQEVHIEDKLHAADLVSTFNEEFKRQGGDIGNVDFILKDAMAKFNVKRRVLDFVSNMMTDKPWRFRRNNRDVKVLPYGSIATCIDKAKMGISFKKVEEGYEIEYTPANFKITIPAGEFQETLAEFFTEACALIEAGKNQVNDFKKTGLVFEFTAVQKLLKSVLKENADQILKEVVSKFTQNVEKVFGKRSCATHVVHYEKNENARPTSLRILADDPPTSADDFMRTIKYSFSIFFFLLLAVICINLYNMEIYKDSLIYAKFLVKKGN